MFAWSENMQSSIDQSSSTLAKAFCIYTNMSKSIGNCRPGVHGVADGVADTGTEPASEKKQHEIPLLVIKLNSEKEQDYWQWLQKLYSTFN